ncbi:hypothetical protein P389DRAFT_165588 [Cystobasidium minutum MCA 4210]|uniref:uncharacterized protein n=1 Tax=Cystobasidium minutum MCA 4210 TaxID=1397322 RepID=UPI0034CD1952|eukprot:jgi/Rhomi1/165588/fgenesh1_kg.1_\
MPKILHIVLCKANPEAGDFTKEWIQKGEAMLGKIPGLLEIRLGDCIEGTKHRTAGYTHLLYSVFDSEDSVRKYATHPVHVDLLDYTKDKFVDKMAFDMEL